MLATPKTDIFTQRLQRAADIVIHFRLDGIERDEYRERYFRAIEESALFLKWHLCGVYTKLPAIEQVNAGCHERYPDILQYVLSQPLVSYRDVGSEFYAMPNHPKEIEDYLQVFRVKFKNIRLPQMQSLDDFLFDPTNDYVSRIKRAQDPGVLSSEDADYLTFNLYVIIKCVNEAWTSLIRMFKDYSEMGKLPVSKTDVVHFSVNKDYVEMQRILSALQQHGFISTDTDVETFYYRMTGRGKPSEKYIRWIKYSAKSKLLNIHSMFDFLALMGVGCEDAIPMIKCIFTRQDNSNIKVNPRTRTSVRRDVNSEYHTLLEQCIGNEV